MPDSVKISIAMATYNGEAYIKEQLDSIFNQTFKDFELIVCDDQSKDKTAEILAEYQKNYPNFKFYINEKNLGFKKNFEKIISLCSGEYIAFCDQDDIWSNNHLQVLIEHIGNNDCIGGNATFINEKGIDLNVTMTKYLLIQHIPQTSQEMFKHELYGNMIQGTASLCSRKILSKALPIPDNVKFHDYWIALNACVNSGCTYIDKPILQYRRHSNNATEYDRFSLFKTIRKINRLSKDKETYYKDWLPYLENLRQKDLSPEKRKSVNEVYNFYQNLASNKKRIPCIFYYIRHYREITLTNYSHILALGFRLFALSLWGIKY